MTPKIIVYLMATMLLIAGCSSSDDFSITWYGYLNPGQMPTVTDVQNYHSNFGSYPTLTDVQYRQIINDPSIWAGFDFPAETK
jgi:hypothetical protein